MFNGELFDFQKKYKKELMDYLDSNNKEVVLESPTGSGKTVLMCNVIDEYLEKYSKTVALWLTPGAGGLEKQSNESFDEFVTGVNSGDVYDFIKDSNPSGKVYFINWEKINRTSNLVLRENEKNDLYNQFRYCHNEKIDIIFIVDEEHKNQDAAKDLIERAEPLHVIRISATPITVAEAKVTIPDEDVIEAGLISDEISINEGISADLENGQISEDNDLYLIEKADEKRKEIDKKYKDLGLDIRSLVLIQFPNARPEYIEKVKRKLDEMGYDDNSGLRTEWYSGEHPENPQELKKLNGQYSFLLFKQAVATGWDCPRAKILVKLREGGTEEFNIQTIGRIRRMPERKHYGDSLVDNCYLYTFDSKFKTGLTKGVNSSFYEYLYKRKNNCFLTGNGIKKEILDGEDKTAVNQEKVIEVIRERMLKEADSNHNGKLEKTELESKGYIFGTKLISSAYEALCRTTSDLMKISNQFNIEHEINLHDDGFIIREAKRQIARSGKLPENVSNNVLRIMFGPMEDENLSIFSNNELEFEKKNKVIDDMSLREFDAFLVNNSKKLQDIFSESNANAIVILERANIIEKDWNIPGVQYYKQHKIIEGHTTYTKNAFDDYQDNILVKPNRSETERQLEGWFQNNSEVEWYYKNGDKGDNYFSIVYDMSFARANFYPDYVLKMKNGNVWIIEAKGGIDSDGVTNNIDKYANNKFNALKKYGEKYKNVHWGFARSVGNIIMFSNTEWDENVYNQEIWKNIADIVK